VAAAVGDDSAAAGDSEDPAAGALLQRVLLRAMVWIAGVYWVGGNSAIYTALHGPRSGYRLEAALDPQSSWLIVSNHQSWADI